VSRSALGFAGLHLVFLAVGMALLYALGLVSQRRHLLTAIGPAYLSGLGAVMPILILLLVAGAPVRLPALGATAAALIVVCVAVGIVGSRRGRVAAAAAPAPPATRGQTWATRAGIAALGLYFAVGASAFAKLGTGNDDWGFWSYKALLFFHFGGHLDPNLFAGRFPGPPHLDYPVLQPLLESLLFRAMGGVHLQEWHIAVWIVFAAFVWTVWFLVRSRGFDSLVVLAPLGALALAPSAAGWAAAGMADVTVASFAAAGALAIGLWLDGAANAYALLGAVLLTAAANTKNEGIAAAAAVLLAAAAALALTRTRRWRGWSAAAAVAAAGTVPWIAWRSAHGLGNDDVPPLSRSLDWGYLTGRLDRLSSAVGKLAAQLANQGVWIWLVPCFLALAIVCFYTRTARREAGFYLAVGAAVLASLVWAYWTGDNLGVLEWLGFSAPRVITSVVFVSGIGAIHLIGKLLDAPRSTSRW
jgi:hypothetical protein